MAKVTTFSAGVGEENISGTMPRIYLGLEALEAGRPTPPPEYFGRVEPRSTPGRGQYWEGGYNLNHYVATPNPNPNPNRST